MSAAPQHLRLNHDAIFVRSGEGALFRTDGTVFTLSEKGTYELMCALAPDLTGECSLDELCLRHDPALRSRIISLVEALTARGILRVERDRRGHLLPESVRSHFSVPLAFLDAIADAPEERFERFRTSTVLLMGNGLSFWRCAAALVRNGLQRLWLVKPAHDSAERMVLDDEVETVRGLGFPTEVTVIEPIGDMTDIGPDELSLVVYAADNASMTDFLRVGHRSLRASCAFLPGFLVDHDSVIGPLMRAPACYVCTFARLAHEVWEPPRVEALVERIEATGGNLASPESVCEPLARRLGGDLAFEAFKMLAGGVRAEIERGLMLQTLVAGGQLRALFKPCTSHWCRSGCRVFSTASAAPHPFTQPC